jgi:hypothetical protein
MLTLTTLNILLIPFALAQKGAGGENGWGGTFTAKSGGSGPYKAKWVTDPTLPKHTIYAPISPPPANVKMPVVVFGEGGERTLRLFRYTIYLR